MKVAFSDLKDNPAFIYTCIHLWMLDAGEDFIDYHNYDGVDFVEWMCRRGYIDESECNRIVSNTDYTDIQSILMDGCCAGNCIYEEYDGDFLEDQKSYQLLAEYMATNDGWINDLIEILSDVADIENPEELELISYNTNAWKDLSKSDIKLYRDEYNYLKGLSINDVISMRKND